MVTNKYTHTRATTVPYYAMSQHFTRANCLRNYVRNTFTYGVLNYRFLDYKSHLFSSVI